MVQEVVPWHLQSFVWESGLFQPADTSQQSRTVTCQLARKKEKGEKEKEVKYVPFSITSAIFNKNKQQE